MNWIAVFIGGGIGSLLRFAIGKLPFSSHLPINTFVANLIACLIFGGVVYFLKPSTNFWHYFLIIGLCGGLSTFSTFSKETFDLIQNGYIAVALLNIVISVGAYLSVFWWMNKN